MADKQSGSQYQFCRSTGIIQPTVQNSLENALKTIFNLKEERPIVVRICSRTDSGVHALKAALHVDLPKFHKSFLRPALVKTKLNTYFKETCSIRITDVIHVPQSFNVQKACLSKTYLYRIGLLKEEFCSKGGFRETSIPVTEVQRTYFMTGKGFDIKKAEEATHLFVGEKDFAAVGRRPTHNTRPTVCNILSFTVENAGPQMPFDCENVKYDYYHFICKGTRFLYHMVRAMVGTVISVGMGRISLDEVRMLFEKPEPSSWLSKVRVVPGHGLYLIDTALDPGKLIMEEKEKDEADGCFVKNTSNETSSGAQAA